MKQSTLSDLLVDVDGVLLKLNTMRADGDVTDTNHSWLKAKQFATDARDRLRKALESAK